MRYHSFAGIPSAPPSAVTSFCNHSATQMLGLCWHEVGPTESRRGTHHARRVCAYSCAWRSCPAGRQRATEATELTEPTNLGSARHVGSRVYYCELWRLAALPGLQLGVSACPREPGYRVEDWTWEARRVRCSVG